MANLGDILQNAINGRAKGPKTIVLPEMTVPANFKAVREKIISYFENPAEYIDMDSIRINNNYGEFRIQPLEQVIGLEALGSGAYSAVYRVDDKALKIVKEQDNAYASFVNFLHIEGHKYSCFPKVHYSGVWGNKTVYILELLEKTSNDNQAERNFLANLVQQAFMCSDGEGPVRNRFVNVPDDFYDGMRALRKYYEEFGRKDRLHPDLHSGNIIIRPNGTPVIIDPFS